MSQWKTSMLFNLDFANNTMLSCFSLFFNYWLILFNFCSYCTNFPIGIPSKQAKTENEIHPVLVEAKIRKC